MLRARRRGERQGRLAGGSESAREEGRGISAGKEERMRVSNMNEGMAEDSAVGCLVRRRLFSGERGITPGCGGEDGGRSWECWRWAGDEVDGSVRGCELVISLPLVCVAPLVVYVLSIGILESSLGMSASGLLWPLLMCSYGKTLNCDLCSPGDRSSCILLLSVDGNSDWLLSNAEI